MRSTAPTSAPSIRNARARPAARTRAPTCDTFTSPKRFCTHASQPCTTSRSTPATCAVCATPSSPTVSSLDPVDARCYEPPEFPRSSRHASDAADPDDAPHVRNLLLHPDQTPDEEAEGTSGDVAKTR